MSNIYHCDFHGGDIQDPNDLVKRHSGRLDDDVYICKDCLRNMNYFNGNGTPAGAMIMKNKRLFMSYSSHDRGKIEELIKNLERIGYEVWYDDRLKYQGGQEWWSRIGEAIQGCDVVLFAYSKLSQASPFCIEEIKYAKLLNRSCIAFSINKNFHFRRMNGTLQNLLNGYQNLAYESASAEELSRLHASIQHPDLNPGALPSPLPSLPDMPRRPIDDFCDAVRTENNKRLSDARQRILLGQAEDLAGDEYNLVELVAGIEMFLERRELNANIKVKLQKLLTEVENKIKKQK